MARPVGKKRENADAVEFETVHDELLEPVNGGNVRRIVFEGRAATPAPEPEPARTEREWMPRHTASMDEIEFEIDHIGRRRPAARRTEVSTRTETLYETESGGAVREAYAPSSRGTKRVLYTTVDKGTHQEERRFSSADVDRLIAGVDLEPEVEVIRTEKTRLVKRRKKVVKKVPVGGAEKPAKKAKKTKAAEPVFEPVDSDYQPQCEAVAKSGLQCRNSSKHGSKYCGAHKGYRPKSLDDALAAKDTAPAHDVAEDTLPGEAASKKSEFQAQCAAYTKDGLQCKNSSRKSSKYCGSHKGYRAPSKKQLLEQMDTKPRWEKAPDTVPNVK